MSDPSRKVIYAPPTSPPRNNNNNNYTSINNDNAHPNFRRASHSMESLLVPIKPNSVFSELNLMINLQILNLFLKEHYILSSILIFVPLGIFTSIYYPNKETLCFVLNFLGIIPLAWLIGKTTEDIAIHTNALIGGLINATFGNIVEMILCISGLLHHQILIVQCTLIGSILSNLLLVTGTAFIWGGIWHKTQRFAVTGARTNCSILLLSVMSLLLPTLYGIVLTESDEKVLEVSRASSLLLLILYAQYIYFQLKTHSFIFISQGTESLENGDDSADEYEMGGLFSVLLLGILTITTSFCSDALIRSIRGAVEESNLSTEFIGIILLPIIGNAAEHYTAITMAGQDKMDLALSVAIGSGCQMALFATPLTVVSGWLLNVDISLDFHVFQVAVVYIAVMVVEGVLSEGKSTWLHGSMLFTAYLIVCIIYYVE